MSDKYSVPHIELKAINVKLSFVLTHNTHSHTHDTLSQVIVNQFVSKYIIDEKPITLPISPNA